MSKDRSWFMGGVKVDRLGKSVKMRREQSERRGVKNKPKKKGRYGPALGTALARLALSVSLCLHQRVVHLLLAQVVQRNLQVYHLYDLSGAGARHTSNRRRG